MTAKELIWRAGCSKRRLKVPSVNRTGLEMETIMCILDLKEFCKEFFFPPQVFGLIAWQGKKSQHNSVELGNEKQQVKRIYETHK